MPQLLPYVCCTLWLKLSRHVAVISWLCVFVFTFNLWVAAWVWLKFPEVSDCCSFTPEANLINNSSALFPSQFVLSTAALIIGHFVCLLSFLTLVLKTCLSLLFLDCVPQTCADIGLMTVPLKIPRLNHSCPLHSTQTCFINSHLILELYR